MFLEARRGVGDLKDRVAGRTLTGGLRTELRLIELGIEADQLHEVEV